MYFAGIKKKTPVALDPFLQQFSHRKRPPGSKQSLRERLCKSIANGSGCEKQPTSRNGLALVKNARMRLGIEVMRIRFLLLFQNRVIIVNVLKCPLGSIHLAHASALLSLNESIVGYPNISSLAMSTINYIKFTEEKVLEWLLQASNTLYAKEADWIRTNLYADEVSLPDASVIS